MIRTVLVPIDFSADSGLVVRFAAGLAALGVRRVVCGHVMDATGLEGPVIAAKVDATRESLRMKVRPLTDAGLDVEIRIPTGDRERELLALAHESHVDAIVAGSSGKSMTDQLFVGSVSERLARDARVPSLILRYDLLRSVEDPSELARSFARSLLVPTDFSPHAARAIVAALGIEPSAIGEVRLLHVLSPSEDEAVRVRQEAGAEAQMDSLLEITREKGLPAVPDIAHGDEPETIILEQIGRHGVTGIIIGSRGRNPIQEALMGSVSMTLLRTASCPVMIVP